MYSNVSLSDKVAETKIYLHGAGNQMKIDNDFCNIYLQEMYLYKTGATAAANNGKCRKVR